MEFGVLGPVVAWDDGGDRIDLTILLEKAGYAGTDPFADGYVSLAARGGDTVLRFDRDGDNSTEEAVALARVGS